MLMLKLITQFRFSNLQKLKSFSPPKPLEAPKFLKPNQHPSEQLTKNIDIIQPNKPERFITEQDEQPLALYMNQGDKFTNNKKYDTIGNKIADKIIHKPLSNINKAIEEQKYLSIAIIGAPNSGKSSLLNYLSGQPISAVSNKSNTTNDEIRGIHTDIDSGVQLQLIDTPGFSSKYKYTKQFVSRAWGVLEESNLALVMVDAVKSIDLNMKPAIERLNKVQIDKEFLRSIQRADNSNNDDIQLDRTPVLSPIPKILVFNKMDLCFNKRKLKWNLAELEDLTKFEKIFYISCLTGFGMQELRQYLYDMAFQCPWKYDESIKNLSSPVDLIEQMVKQAVFKRFYKEIPFIMNLQLKEFRVTNKASAKMIFQLNVQTENQARIVIGDDARNLKQIKQEIEIQLAKTYQRRFQVVLTVTVKKGDLSVQFDSEKEDLHTHAQMKLKEGESNKNSDRKKQLNEQFGDFMSNL